MNIEIFADKITVRGPKIDGGYNVTFEVGEHEQQHVAELLAVPQQTVMKLNVTVPESADAIS